MRALFILLLLSATAHAQTIGVDVEHRYHSRGLSRREAREVFKSASAQIEAETGLRLVARRFVSQQARPVKMRENDGGWFGPHGSAVSQLSTWNFPQPGSRLVLRIAPRYFLAGRWWSAGVAPVCGQQATAIVGRLKRYGPSGLLHAQTVVVHELGHALGAEHDGERCSVMRPDAGAALLECNWRLSFTAAALGQIVGCQERRR